MAGFTPPDIALLTEASDPRVSPNGQSVAFTVKTIDVEPNAYRSAIWLASVEGGAPRPFTAEGGEESLARWSPDGGLLAFVSKREGESRRLCVLPVQGGGERTTICTWPDDITEVEWSPDGQALAFVARDRDMNRYGRPEEERKARDMPPRRVTRFMSRLDTTGWIVDRPARVFVVPADGTTRPRSLTPGDTDASGLAWSPDGSQIVFASARHPTWDLDLAVDLHIADVNGTAVPTCLTESVAAYSHPAWAPSGDRIAYLRQPTPLDEPRHARVGVIDLSDGKPTDLTVLLDRNCAPYPVPRGPLWDGDDILFGVEDAGNVHLYRAGAVDGEAADPLIRGQRWLHGWDKAGGTLAFVASSPTSVSELQVVVGTTERQVTGFSRILIDKLELSTAARFVATSADGAEVECWAMAPVDSEPGRSYPTLLNIHGGPFTQYGNKFLDEFQLQAGGGFGVLYCNPRGSSGYSEAWGRATRWPECEVDPGSGWGGVDYDDVLACVEEAGRRFTWFDTARAGVLGGSYGGYMTSWIIGHTDRFAAACSERSCNNLLTLEQHSDFATFFRTMVGATHLENPAAYLRQSPINYVENMTTPVLILHSEDDWRCPINQADELFVALRLLGRAPELLRFPGETHELSRSGSPRHRIQRAEAILEWFRRHLGA